MNDDSETLVAKREPAVCGPVSLTDVDMYKMTMMQAVLHNFPSAMVRYDFVCRSGDLVLTPKEQETFRLAIDNVASLRLTSEEESFLRSIRFMKPDFVDFLVSFRLDTDYVKYSFDPHLTIHTEGPWLSTILFETMILSIVTEIVCSRDVEDQDGTSELWADDDWFLEFPFMEFGTRRRKSYNYHSKRLQQLRKRPTFLGTSNLHFARLLDIRPFGTMAHEWIQAGQAFAPARLSQQFMLEKWIAEYRGDLGYALTDTLGMSSFVDDFDLYLAKLYDGVRHDSGDPINWYRCVLAMYENLGIDPATKKMVFSDGLSPSSAQTLWSQIGRPKNTMFAIGTKLTNKYMTISGKLKTAPSVVMKMTMCNGQPVIKVSDDPGKSMSRDKEYFDYMISMIRTKSSKYRQIIDIK